MSSSRSTIRIFIAMVCLSLLFGSEAFAQTTGTQFFRMTVNEGISLGAPGDVVISHDQSNNDQVFPEQPWVAYTSNMAGATVDFTIGKFIHEDFSFFRRNSIIDLRVISSTGNSNWVTTVDNDQTTGYFFGSQTATVSAESFASGEGVLGITVAFDEFNSTFLAAGRYNTTVVGTISNK